MIEMTTTVGSYYNCFGYTAFDEFASGLFEKIVIITFGSLRTYYIPKVFHYRRFAQLGIATARIGCAQINEYGSVNS